MLVQARAVQPLQKKKQTVLGIKLPIFGVIEAEAHCEVVILRGLRYEDKISDETVPEYYESLPTRHELTLLEMWYLLRVAGTPCSILLNLPPPLPPSPSIEQKKTSTQSVARNRTSPINEAAKNKEKNKASPLREKNPYIFTPLHLYLNS